jgi:hypothetical protein
MTLKAAAPSSSQEACKIPSTHNTTWQKKFSVYPEKQNQLHLLDELCSCCCYIMCLLQNLGGDGWMGTLNIHFTNPGIKSM